MSCAPLNPYPEAANFRRAPSEVMTLARMGSAHPTRLSFLRTMLRRMSGDDWRFERSLWQVDSKGVGRAVYRAIGPDRIYSLVAFSHDLPPEMRSDRVIATAWDATFTLFDGTPTEADLDRLQANVPLQEAGRISSRELSMSRANRSVRLFALIVDSLAAGNQPDRAEVDAVGYLMRTTAVYGSGKFGAADRSKIADRPELSGPFQAEMLSVWLTRQFTVDIVEYLARVKGGEKAIMLAKDIKQSLGVGNSTGLGMAPFLVRHPALINNWMLAREEALARVRSQSEATEQAIAGLSTALQNAKKNVAKWHSEHPIQMKKLDALRADLNLIQDYLKHWPTPSEHPWNTLWLWGGKTLSLEGQEALLAMMFEPHGDLVDGLSDCMNADESQSFVIDGAMTIGALKEILTSSYGWAGEIDFTAADSLQQFWYVSEEKLEPRLGDRYSEDGAELELPLGIARLASNLGAALTAWDDDACVAHFLAAEPDHRFMVRRVQCCVDHPFSEVRGNLNAHDMLPIDLLRCKLAYFGASRFDPRSDRWLRISLFQDHPYPSDLNWEAVQ